MFKKLLVALISVAFLAAVPTVSASAGPPESIEVDFFDLYLDQDEGKSIWVNITALDFCLWAFGGFAGPAPVIDPALPATLIPTGAGGEKVVASINTDGVYIEVYELDNPDGPFIGACEDILDQLIAGTGPWATGTTSLNARTNNLGFFGPPTGPRSTSNSASLTAMVTTESGDAYRYKVNVHNNDRCSDFSCFVTNTSLRAL